MWSSGVCVFPRAEGAIGIPWQPKCLRNTLFFHYSVVSQNDASIWHAHGPDSTLIFVRTGNDAKYGQFHDSGFW